MESEKEEYYPKSVMNVNAYKLENPDVENDDEDYLDSKEYKPREITKKNNSKTLKGFCSDDIKKKLADLKY